MTTNHHLPIAHLPQPATPENQENPVIAEYLTATDDGTVKCVVRVGRPQPKPQS